MAKAKGLVRTRKPQRRKPDEGDGAVRPASTAHQPELMRLQNQIGNRAVQRLLAQRHQAGVVQLDQAEAVALVNRAPWEEDEGTAVEALSTGKDDGEVKIEDVVCDYYDVSGSTLTDVNQQLDPEEWGRCSYTFDFNYDSTNGKTSKVNITLKLIIRLPRWTNIDTASPPARRAWNRMIEALKGHEEKHAELARTWAPVFKARLLGIGQDKVAAKHKSTLDEVDKATKKYDNDTKHGRTEGVALDTTIP